MKKLFFILAAFGCALSLHATTTFTFTSAADINQTIDSITVALAQGNNTSYGPVFQNTYYNSEYHPEMRLYLGNTITISSEEALTNIQLVFAKSGASNKEYTGLSASNGTLVSGGVSESTTDWKVDSWTGNATQVVFTLTGKGQRQIQRIVIDGEPIVIDPVEPDPLPTADDLEEDFDYGDPTVIFPKDTTILKQEYAFIDNNILVHCTQGSIIKATDSTSAYFNCNANNSLTFETTKPMKGLVIAGMVRRQFDALVNKGHIEYCSPGELEEDYEGNPVVIITDIDSTAVTISCPKQVRCYAVRVYFDANPTEELDCEGGSGEGEVINLTFDKADAVYESEISADEGKPNYTIYLMQEANPEYPYITLDLYPAVQGDLVGSYNMEDGSLGESTWYQYGESGFDRTWMESDGAVAVSKQGEIYTVAGYITCDDNNTYNFSFSGPMPFYTDTEYYDGQQGIDETQVEQQAQKILRRGQLLIQRNHSVYDVTGRRVE